jgi:hypothetical protein
MGITSEVKKAPRSKEIEQRVITVTPAHAEKWLEMNTGNRRIRPSHVRHLARQMEMGRWMLSPEPIVFSPQRLLDGQHRLSAVLMSGCTIEASVALVQNEDVFRVLDQGVNRNNSDLTGIPSTVLQPLQWLMKQSLSELRKGKIVIDDIMRVKDENIFTLSNRINDVIKPKDRRFKSAPFRASYIMAVDLKMCDLETADRIYTDLSHMNMTDWSRMMQNIFHRFESTTVKGTLNSLKSETFMAGMYLFSEANSKKTKIILTEKFISETEKRVRNRINLLYRKTES